MLNRALLAALMNGSLYRQLSDDPRETFTALAIVALSGIAMGVGIESMRLPKWEGAAIWIFVFFSIWARLVGWFLWAGVAFLVGTKAFGGQAGYRQVLRSIGFTYGPGMLALFSGIPIAGPVLLGLSFLWIFPAGLIAIRETQRLNWVQASICCMIGWPIGIVLLPLVIFQSTRYTP